MRLTDGFNSSFDVVGEFFWIVEGVGITSGSGFWGVFVLIIENVIAIIKIMAIAIQSHSVFFSVPDLGFPEEPYFFKSSDSTLLDKPRQTPVSFNAEADLMLVTKTSKPSSKTYFLT